MPLEKFQNAMNTETEIWDISSHQLSVQSMVQQISRFHYDPEADQTFTNWSGECEDVFRNDLAHIPLKKKPVYCYVVYRNFVNLMSFVESSEYLKKVIKSH
ncbi:hypothetical protein ACTXT7_013764 [Hymenolepis weldensis]